MFNPVKEPLFILIVTLFALHGCGPKRPNVVQFVEPTPHAASTAEVIRYDTFSEITKPYKALGVITTRKRESLNRGAASLIDAVSEMGGDGIVGVYLTDGDLEGIDPFMAGLPVTTDNSFGQPYTSNRLQCTIGIIGVADSAIDDETKISLHPANIDEVYSSTANRYQTILTTEKGYYATIGTTLVNQNLPLEKLVEKYLRKDMFDKVGYVLVFKISVLAKKTKESIQPHIRLETSVFDLINETPLLRKELEGFAYTPSRKAGIGTRDGIFILGWGGAKMQNSISIMAAYNLIIDSVLEIPSCLSKQ
jgi:hypothetical protein